MALRLVNKINRDFVRNVCRSVKTEAFPESERVQKKQQQISKIEPKSVLTSELYEVSSPRTSSTIKLGTESQKNLNTFETDHKKTNQIIPQGCAFLQHPAGSSTLQTRFYSSNKGKQKPCRKLEKPKKSCPRFISPRCKPPKNILCTKRRKWPPCTKKEAPYPSYSETCHEDPYQKPSECKLCPWKPEDHPTFKPPKNKYHTATSLEHPKMNIRRQSDLAHTSVKNKKQMRSSGKENTSNPKKQIAVATLLNSAEESILLTEKVMRKEMKSCSSKKTQQKTKFKGKKHMKATENSLNGEVESWLLNLKPKSAKTEGAGKSCASEEEVKERFKKFPFQNCDFPLEKKKTPPEKRGNKCPKKKGPKLVKDCPPEVCDRMVPTTT